jgi:hypothetical protein
MVAWITLSGLLTISREAKIHLVRDWRIEREFRTLRRTSRLGFEMHGRPVMTANALLTYNTETK